MALRELFVKIRLDSGNAHGELQDMSRELDRASTEFRKMGNASTGSLKQTSDAFYELGRAALGSEPSKELQTMAKTAGVSEQAIEKLLKKTREDMKLDEQFREAARAAGMTEREIDKVKSSIDKAKESSASWKGIMSGLAALGGLAVLTGFGNKAVEESNKAENAIIGFKTVVKNTLGIGAVDETTKGVEQLFQKLGGSMDMSAIQMSVKNLLGAGFSASQALELVEKNAYMASVNRQAHYKTIGEAVQVYTEGIKNNNAMLTDSTGISENLSVTLKKVGLKMDDLNVASKRAAVLQAIHNMHTKEAGQYLDAYNSQMAGYQGRVIKANSAMTKILQTSGDFIKKALTPLIQLANPILTFFSDSERGAARTSFALTVLTAVIGVGLVSATYAWATSLDVVTLSAVKAYIALVGPAILLAAKLIAVYLILEDIWVFFEYGPDASETYFADLMRWLGVTDEELRGMHEAFKEFKVFLGEVGAKFSELMQNKAFKYMLIGVIGLIAAIILFKVLLIAGIVFAIMWIVARWDWLVMKFKEGWNWLVEFLKASALLTGKLLISFLFPLAGLYIFRDELSNLFSYLWGLLTQFPFVQRLVEQFQSLKARISEALSGIWDTLKSTMSSLLPVDTINNVIDMINMAMNKLSEFSKSTLLVPDFTWADIPRIQARAAGGPVNAGSPYLVGERGPELVVPKNDGTVIPNDRLQAAGGNNPIVFNANFTINGGGNAREQAIDIWETLKQLAKDNSNEIRVQLGLKPV